MAGSLAVPPPEVATVLVVLPLAYQLNDRLAPWGGGRLAADRDRYLSSWTSVAALHWASTLVVLALVVASGTPGRAVGLHWPHHPTTPVFGVGVAGGLALYIREVLGRGPLDPDRLRRRQDARTPATRHEQWVGLRTLCVTPGFCEEVVYRGFALTGLLAAGLGPAAAVGVAAVPFVLLHGRPATASPRTFARFAPLGIAFSALFLRYGSVWPGVALHTAFNLAQTVRGVRRYGRPAESTER